MNHKVFEFFEEISSIPRGSRNTDAISEYCVKFAQQRGLRVRRDGANNVIIWKAGSAGREQEPAVILQGHLDMVNEKTSDSTHNFETDGLELIYEGDWLHAKDTTLGGDDGIAIAYALTILDDDTLSHPPLEVVFTTDEEIGMIGAARLDMSELTGKYLLNIDSEEEDTILVSCAGGLTSICKIPMETVKGTGMLWSVQISGLKGGHSGVEIDKERANAVIEAGKLLAELEQIASLAVCSIEGGLKDNAIPRECRMLLIVKEEDCEKLRQRVAEREKKCREEFASSDGEIQISLQEQGTYSGEVLSGDSLEKVLLFLNLAPNGVQHWSMEVEDLVETSLNLGIFRVDAESMSAEFSVRSSVTARKEMLGMKLKRLTRYLGGSYTCQGNYPAWEYRKDSRLRELMTDTYREMFGKELKVKAIHAGLECGYFRKALPQADIVSFGPDILDIHTTEERMSISSARRVYDYIIEILKRI